VDVVHTDDNTVQFLDEAGMTFMALMIHELNQALKANGVVKPQQRQEIYAGFLCNFAYNIDAGWFIQGDKKLFPKVCLGERAEPKEDENLGVLSKLHVPTEATSWHEYAHGVVSQYFEDDSESVAGIRTGSYKNEY
jgi:hypothetical protein